MADCDLAVIARQTLADLAPAALEKEIELELSSPDSATIKGNADMLGILLRNLVDNAIRYTPRKGQVNVSLTVEQGRVRLEVTDSGPGIPEQEQAAGVRPLLPHPRQRCRRQRPGPVHRQAHCRFSRGDALPGRCRAG